ncbi:hypothetical protein AVEN_109150-1 [Araneus ventricosus]|uniref:Uncharacterized protein n=1 Tax=Araneus ventricosus TaxID=182803 RepID=A0A4Y2ITA8_ARAVE|nr:hypothetical protein AVEN_109150-1 [Araneus ventricosus]
MALESGALTVEQINRLHTVQNVFLLKLLRSYKTAATQTFIVKSSISPLHLKANYECLKFEIWSDSATVWRCELFPAPTVSCLIFAFLMFLSTEMMLPERFSEGPLKYAISCEL